MKKSPIQKLLLSVVFSLFVALGLSQSTVYRYELEFPKYDMTKIKPLVALTQPLFTELVNMSADNHQIFVFYSTTVVTEEDVVKALEGTEYELLHFSALVAPTEE